jgi:hypothetical protein
MSGRIDVKKAMMVTTVVVGAMASSVAKQEVACRTEEEATIATIATQF